MKKDSSETKFASTLLDDLFREEPLLHVAASGELTDLSMPSEVLTYINNLVTPDMVTVETGAGYSTLVFAANECQHTVYCQADGTIQRLRDWALEKDLSLGSVTFIEGRTDATLPTTRPNVVGLALLDGGTGFPLPLLDYFYLGPSVAEGSVLIIHDAYHASAKVLCDFLREDYYWEQIDSFALEMPGRSVERTAVFRKVANNKPRTEWHEQPWSVKHLDVPRKLLRY